jgi:plasmid stabilization system protein ParE
MPHCGRIVPEFEIYKFREVIYQNYRIVYRIREDTNIVEILGVVHGAREIRKALREEWEL